MKHNHSCECEHSNVQYCKKCKVVHCLECNQEWRTVPNYTNTYSYPYWGQLSNISLGQYTQHQNSQTAVSNQMQNSSQAVCNHQGQ